MVIPKKIKSSINLNQAILKKIRSRGLVLWTRVFPPELAVMLKRTKNFGCVYWTGIIRGYTHCLTENWTASRSINDFGCPDSSFSVDLWSFCTKFEQDKQAFGPRCVIHSELM